MKRPRFVSLLLDGNWRPPYPGYSWILVAATALFIVLFVIGLLAS